ncbi:MAG: response regulator transcription factor [Gallionellaceae bacterium]|nr:response regulator transcription factor [Gallionellaceae bacterium]
MIRILIADDHAIMRDGLKQILAGCGDMCVAGEADDGPGTLNKIRHQEFDVVLLDMSMPGKSGIELIRQIKDEKPRLPILVLSMHKEKQYAGHAMRAGASGYLCKASASSKLVQALRKVAGGGIYLSPEATEIMAMDSITSSVFLPHSLLSEREFQIFKLLAAGSGVTEIANELNLSVKTVSTHKTHIMQKMNLSNITSLVRYALMHGFVDTPDEF